MKTLFPLLAFITFVCCSDQKTASTETDSSSVKANAKTLSKQDLFGAWEAMETTDSGTIATHIVIFTENYFSEAIYFTQPATFSFTLGGSWELENNTVMMNLEYNSQDTTKVGTKNTMNLQKQGNNLLAAGLTWKKVDDGTPGELPGAWLITGRKRDGEMSRRIPGERKTMKILSGTRFQWIAYHTGTGRFSGTGGGTYTTKDGKYTENIEFFSRDNSRVGASLEFEYALDSGEWHHSGLSSKGNPIYEIWTPRSMLEN